MHYQINKIPLIVLLVFLTTGCSPDNNAKKSLLKPKKLSSFITDVPLAKRGKPKAEMDLVKQGLVNILEVDSSLKIEVRYSTPHNFVGIDLYGELDQVYLQPDVAHKLSKAQQYLKDTNNTLSLLVFDGVRPLHIQQLMWDTLKIPLHEKTKFLSNPKNHSVHNYGAAVDLTLVNQNGEELDMGTPYDFIGKLCYPRLEQQFLASGELTQSQINNRKLLRYVMTKAGFRVLPTEWWHFNSVSRAQAKLKYQLVK